MFQISTDIYDSTGPSFHSVLLMAPKKQLLQLLQAHVHILYCVCNLSSAHTCVIQFIHLTLLFCCITFSLTLSTCEHLPLQSGSLAPPLQHGAHRAPPLQNRLDHCNREDRRFRGAHLTRGGQCYSLSSRYTASFSSPSYPWTHRLLFDQHHALLPTSRVTHCVLKVAFNSEPRKSHMDLLPSLIRLHLQRHARLRHISNIGYNRSSCKSASRAGSSITGWLRAKRRGL